MSLLVGFELITSLLHVFHDQVALPTSLVVYQQSALQLYKSVEEMLHAAAAALLEAGGASPFLYEVVRAFVPYEPLVYAWVTKSTLLKHYYEYCRVRFHYCSHVITIMFSNQNAFLGLPRQADGHN